MTTGSVSGTGEVGAQEAMKTRASNTVVILFIPHILPCQGIALRHCFNLR